ncbi:MAG: STAS domain-containing protein [Xanthomonadales bacterium]|nr:STAS domain-containing protein [Xanthomonadales bacterium]
MSTSQPTPGFVVETHASDTLALRGVLGFATAGQALLALQAALSAGPQPGTLDLSGLAHVDSAGLACLLVVLGEASTAGRELRLAHAPDNMRTLAQVCGVDHLLAA